MDLFFRAIAIALVSVIMILLLKKTSSETGLLLSIFVCGIILFAALSRLQPIMEFIHRIELLTKLDGQMIRIILKVVGLTITAEIAELICADSGNQALGKSLQILASLMVIIVAMPLLSSLLDLIEEVMTRL